MEPLTVYINWASYDELSDNVELTEKLAMQQLKELLRLRTRGVRLDYYMMDAFWYAQDGAYRAWRQPNWPNGPDRWLKTCKANDVKPGVWLSTNTLCHLQPAPAWESSLNRQRSAMCMFDGGFLPDLIEAMQLWYDKGVRMFKFDFCDLNAATPAMEALYLPDEIRSLNAKAFRTALTNFRTKNPEIKYLAYNGFGGLQDNTSRPFIRCVDIRWLDVFDSLYCGDPRPADVPTANFWRSKDIYSDHMVRNYERQGIPLERIDNTAFMVGLTGTCYGRGTAAWKGMLVLSLGRGNLMNTYYGNLELIDDKKAQWFAKAQAIFLPLQATGKFTSFGGIPGKSEGYGYTAVSSEGALQTVVNPSQTVMTIPLPVPSRLVSIKGLKVLFHDSGFKPQLGADSVTLGPEQMCVVGRGAYANNAYDLGVEEDVCIPRAIKKLEATFQADGPSRIHCSLKPPKTGDLRIIMRQHEKGLSYRTSGGSPPLGLSMSKMLNISVEQEGVLLPVTMQCDKVIWSGSSWTLVEVKASDTKPGKLLKIVCATEEKRPLTLVGEIYQITW